MINKVYNEDCFEFIKSVENNSIDLILTDPPYNIAEKSKLTKVGNKIKSNDEAWGNDFKDSWSTFDDYVKWLLNIIPDFHRVLKNDGSLILFLDRAYTGYFIYCIKQFNFIFRNKMYFIKNNPLPHFRKNNYRSTVEECIWLTKDKYNINFLSQQEMKQCFYGNIGRKETKHPTEKYSWMIEPLILRHSKENDVVLDPFAGSGSVLIEALKHKRNFIGVEKNKQFYDIITDRLKSF